MPQPPMQFIHQRGCWGLSRRELRASGHIPEDWSLRPLVWVVQQLAWLLAGPEVQPDTALMRSGLRLVVAGHRRSGLPTPRGPPEPPDCCPCPHALCPGTRA